ncbi:nucleotidyltransferase domain-containing protein [Pseudonocardia sp. GCM10023141]|uniref:nucleotidyltransferase domain-containing protein n=1 Tax=Pseudonocardia sp. GCM10023141 TaxID=3252653 RepID=UPI00360C1AC0
MDPRQATELAQRVVARRWPAALAVVLAGSNGAGRATPTSDLDLVVLLPPPGPVLRETVGRAPLTELFVHTAESWQVFVAKETAARRSPLLHMCASGVLVRDVGGHGARLQREARHRWAAGPPPLTSAESNDRRYVLTALVDDLGGSCEPDELLTVGAEVFAAAGELTLLRRRRWLGRGKWLVRRWSATDPDGCAAACSGLRRLAATGDPRELVAAAARALDAAGGRVGAGYRRLAPDSTVRGAAPRPGRSGGLRAATRRELSARRSVPRG